jgi:class 3 adenylate cyclase
MRMGRQHKRRETRTKLHPFTRLDTAPGLAQVTRVSSHQPPADRAELKRLLLERNQHPHRALEIDEQINRTFGRKVSMLVLDMSGFSRLTAKYGIIHFLAMIHDMEQGATPAVTGNGGQVIKQEADNLFAIFPDPGRALEAALDIFRAFDAINVAVAQDRDLYGSIGIGFGDTLVIGESDLFGNEMNLASKLGEDLAERSEILLTAAAFEALPAGKYELSTRSYEISQMQMPAYRFERSLHPRIPKPAAVE